MHPGLKSGLRFEWSYVVPAHATVPRLYHDTAFARDMPDVLATGYMVGMMELACVNGIMPFVDWPGEQSVGVHVDFSHVAPTPPGMKVTVHGELVEVDGRRLRFYVAAWDGEDKIGVGTHVRMLILPEKFNARLAEKIRRAGP
jgi:fluoroacetyl-CoA thioesterase